MGRNSDIFYGSDVDDRGWVWGIKLCDLLGLVLIPEEDGNNNVNSLDNVNGNGGGGGNILSLLQRHGGRQGQEGAVGESLG